MGLHLKAHNWTFTWCTDLTGLVLCRSLCVPWSQQPSWASGNRQNRYRLGNTRCICMEDKVNVSRVAPCLPCPLLWSQMFGGGCWRIWWKERWFPPAASPSTGQQTATPAAAPKGETFRLLTSNKQLMPPAFNLIYCILDEYPDNTVCLMLWHPESNNWRMTATTAASCCPATLDPQRIRCLHVLVFNLIWNLLCKRAKMSFTTGWPPKAEALFSCMPE